MSATSLIFARASRMSSLVCAAEMQKRTRPAPLEALAGEEAQLHRHVDEHGNDRAVPIAVEVQAHVNERLSEEVGVLRERGELPLSEVPANFSPDDAEGAEHLRRDDRRHGVVIDHARAVPPQVLDDALVGGDVAAHAPEGLGEGAHADGDILGVHAVVLGHPAARLPQRADRPTDLALHGVDALHHHEHLLPAEARPRLAERDRLPQDLVQLHGVIVCEAAHVRPAGAAAIHDGRVVELVGHDEISLATERRQHGGVGAIAHVEHDGVLLAQKVRDARFQLLVDRRGAEVAARRAERHRQLVQLRQDELRAGLLPVVAKAQVVVAGQVQALLVHLHRRHELDTGVVIGAEALHHVDARAGLRVDRPIERTSSIEAGPVVHELAVAGLRARFTVARHACDFAQHVSQPANDDEEHVAQVRGHGAQERRLRLSELHAFRGHLAPACGV
eukprot:scaffold380_cov272-Pinguiococcus_pyrenoidosus.AAC.12